MQEKECSPTTQRTNAERNPRPHDPPSATLPAAVRDTILASRALLFLTGAGGDMAAARLAALQMLAVYHPETEDEFRLAAQIISFSFHALEALSQAATPDMPLTRILRLRSSAVSLSRESYKAERRLDQLRKARRIGALSQPTAIGASHSGAAIEKALELIADTRAVTEAANKGNQTWTQAYQQRLRARRMTENLKKNQAGRDESMITLSPRIENPFIEADFAVDSGNKLGAMAPARPTIAI